jgi:chromosome segregation ATPase
LPEAFLSSLRGLSRTKANLLKSLLSDIVDSLRNGDEGSILDEALQALELTAAWLGIDISSIVSHVSEFKHGMAQVNEARHLKVDPSVEEKRDRLRSLLPELEFHEADVAAVQRDRQAVDVEHQEAAGRLAEIENEMARLRAEHSVVHLKLSKLDGQKARLQSSIDQREATCNAVRARVAELQRSLQDTPDPAQALAEAEARQKTVAESVVNLLEQCLKTLDS